MKLLVKTLKGGKFEIQVEESQTVQEVKGIIETAKSEMPAANQKLIHSGKVLKDEDTIGSTGIKENDFLVVMITKPKKQPVAKVETKPTAAPPATEPTPKAPTTTTATTTTTTETPAATNTTTPAAPTRNDPFPEDAVQNLVTMGFPEPEVRHCLRAAHGNPDVAVEFLTNGIPEGVAEAANMVQATTSTPVASGGGPLQGLRNHPQFDALRRLVQSNPAALQQVLTQIGQQQPDLLAEINSNQALFLEMMNEPIAPAAPSSGGSAPGGASPAGLPGGPAQMAAMLQNMSEAELQQMATMMGLTPEQLRATAQAIGQMPPEQLNQFMMQAMGGGGVGGGGMPGGPQVLQLTQEEMAAVDRLTEMGFDRSEAAQAFLACDKNEALAANLLMDSMANGGMFGGDDSGGGGGDSNNDNNNNNNSGGGGNSGGTNDEDDNMYD